MVIFKFKFLLAFSPKPEKPKKEKHQKKETSAKKAKANKQNEINIPDPEYLIRLEKTCCSAHIEYELIPGKCRYQLDVLCWTKACKIFSPDGTKIIKTITRKGQIFVPICVEHYIKELSVDELLALQSSVIEINVFADKGKLGNSAKANKTDVLYIKETDIDKDGFVEAYSENVNFSKTSTAQSSKSEKSANIEDFLANQKNEAYSVMRYEDNCLDKLYDIIEFVSNETAPPDLVIFKEFVKPYQPEETKPKEGKQKKSKKPPKKDNAKKSKAEKNPTKITLQIQGEAFFTDPELTVFRVENYKCEVSRFFAVFSVYDLLTRFQKIHLNPIVIKILNINNFPVEAVENTGFTDLYCKFSIPCVAEKKTQEKPIEQNIFFNDSHIYFTHHLSKIKLLEFLESRRLVVEIYGVKRYPLIDTNPKLFGEKPEDKFISRIYSEFENPCLRNEEASNSRDVLLAYCSYDLSSLLRNVWDYKSKAQLHNIENSTFLRFIGEDRKIIPNQKANCDFYSTHGLNCNKINLSYIGKCLKSESASTLKEWMLQKHTTTLSLEAYLLSPQAAALVLHQIPNTYKRLFLIVYKRSVAVSYFTSILEHNEPIICHGLGDENILTGFVIDNGNHIALYVEGPSVGIILNLWQDMDNLPVEDGKVFFNTDQAYENRLYDICNKWNGFYILSLKIPLCQILKGKKKNFYVKGNAPIRCSKTLSKLDLLFKTRTMKIMMQYELLPTVEELVSVDLEYGVPFAWKKETSIHSTSVGTVEDGLDISYNM